MIKQDEELDKLEEDIRKLKVKYEMFFMGTVKMPPQHERHMLEVSIFEIGKQKMRDATRRFRYNQLLSRYNQFRELWGRKMREREEARSTSAGAKRRSTRRPKNRRLPRRRA